MSPRGFKQNMLFPSEADDLGSVTPQPSPPISGIHFGTSTWAYPGWVGIVYSRKHKNSTDYLKCAAMSLIFVWNRFASGFRLTFSSTTDPKAVRHCRFKPWRRSWPRPLSSVRNPALRLCRSKFSSRFSVFSQPKG